MPTEAGPQTCAEAAALRPPTGAVVWLKSGGAAMTVVGESCSGPVEVAWLTYSGELHEEAFPAVCLTVERPSSPDDFLPF